MVYLPYDGYVGEDGGTFCACAVSNHSLMTCSFTVGNEPFKIASAEVVNKHYRAVSIGEIEPLYASWWAG